MSTAKEIVRAIDELPADELKLLRRLLADRDWDAWDRQIEADHAAGKLDRLIADVDAEIDAGHHAKL